MRHQPATKGCEDVDMTSVHRSSWILYGLGRLLTRDKKRYSLDLDSHFWHVSIYVAADVILRNGRLRRVYPLSSYYVHPSSSSGMWLISRIYYSRCENLNVRTWKLHYVIPCFSQSILAFSVYMQRVTFIILERNAKDCRPSKQPQYSVHKDHYQYHSWCFWSRRSKLNPT